MKDTQRKEEVKDRATTLFQSAKKYIRKADMALYHRCKNLSKSDMDFLEQLTLIHIKNIAQGMQIPQNLSGVLDNFLLENLFSQHFFTSLDMLYLACYRLSILPHSMLLRDVRARTKKILKDSLKKYKPYKYTTNLLYVLEPLPNIQSDIESFLQTCLELFTQEKIQGLIMHPLSLALNPAFKTKEQLKEQFTQNLSTLLNNSNAKKLILDNDCEYMDSLLESIEEVVSQIGYQVDITLTLPSYHLLSSIWLDRIAAVSKRLCAQKKAKLTIRLKDVDFSYEVMEFQATHTHAMNAHFTNKANALANMLSLLKQCAHYKDILTCHVVSSNFLLIPYIQSLDIAAGFAGFEGEVALHYPFYRIMRHTEIPFFATQYYTTHFTDTLAPRLRSAYTHLKYGLLDFINMLYNKTEWDSACKTFLHALDNANKEKNNRAHIYDSKEDIQALQNKQYNFETFDYTLRKPLAKIESQDTNTKDSSKQAHSSIDSMESAKSMQSEESFLHALEELSIIMPNVSKLEDILYLNAEDMYRLNMQSMNNAPTSFSLYAEKEKEALELAHKKQDEVLQNRISIITAVIGRLHECKCALFATLCALYPNTPPFIHEEQVYILLDSFKYYAYAYKELLQETESVLLMPLGNVFVHTKKLAIHEIGAIIASNIMVGNVSFLEDSALGRIFYYIFLPLFDFCPFLGVIDKKANMNNFIHYTIIPKQDFTSLKNAEKQSNFLVWDKGVSVVFISSFYNVYEAAKEVQYMRASAHAHIIIYTDSYIYDTAKQIFIPLQVTQISLADLIANLPEDTSNFSLFTYNKAEMNYVISKLKVSLCINGAYKSKLISGSPRTFTPGFLPPFGSKLLLGKLVQTSPNSVILNNSLYSDIIGCFGAILSVDEIEFLYNLNHNYSQFLANLTRIASLDNIYESKKPYALCVRVYENDDFFHVCVLMLIAFLLQIETRLSFVPHYFEKDKEIPKKLEQSLQEKYIDTFTLVFEEEEAFKDSITPQTLVRILQDEKQFSTTKTYEYFSNKGVIAEYSLPILNKNLELERYLATQYIQIEHNIFLQTDVGG